MHICLVSFSLFFLSLSLFLALIQKLSSWPFERSEEANTILLLIFACSCWPLHFFTSDLRPESWTTLTEQLKSENANFLV